jgi:hypothetical protein
MTGRRPKRNFNFCGGHRYVGGFLGTNAALQQWLAPQLQEWVRGVESLVKVARPHPQTAYAGLTLLGSLTLSLQQEWQYLQRVIPNCGEAFEPVEEAIRMVFLPALLQATEEECQRELTSLSVCQAGLGLPDPTLSAQSSWRNRDGARRQHAHEACW